jgi:hypothetical protein
LVGVNQLVRQVLLGGVFAHLDDGPSDYSWIIGVWLGLHAEELSKQHPVGLDPQECFTEVDEDRDVVDVKSAPHAKHTASPTKLA